MNIFFNLFYPQGEYFGYFSESNVEIYFSFHYEYFTEKFVTDIITIFELPLKLNRLKYQNKELKAVKNISKLFNEMMINNFDYSLELFSDEGNRLMFHRPFHYKSPPDVIVLSMHKETYDDLEQSDEWKYLMALDFLSCFIINENYSNSQNDLNAFAVKYHGIPKTYFSFTMNDTGDKVVDITQNGGKLKVIADTWLMASWKMYFGNGFYKLVEKEKLKKFQQAYRITELNDNKLYIHLYDRFDEPHFRKNRKIQLLFLNYIGFNELIKKDRN